jgi:hypothetical protein
MTETIQAARGSDGQRANGYYRLDIKTLRVVREPDLEEKIDILPVIDPFGPGRPRGALKRYREEESSATRTPKRFHEEQMDMKTLAPVLMDLFDQSLRRTLSIINIPVDKTTNAPKTYLSLTTTRIFCRFVYLPLSSYKA